MARKEKLVISQTPARPHSSQQQDVLPLWWKEFMTTGTEVGDTAWWQMENISLRLARSKKQQEAQKGVETSS